MVLEKSLRQYVAEALARKVGIGHFNIANLEGFWAIVDAQEAISKLTVAAGGEPVPVIIGASEGERDFMGVDQIVALVASVRRPSAKFPQGRPIFLNADHTYSFERVKEAVDAGFDAVIYDGTELPFDQNVATTKKCADYVREVNEKSKKAGTSRDILLEAEIGFIGKSSKVLDAIPVGVKITEEFLTKPDEAAKFVQATGVDMLAPAVGNIHGMLKGGKDPALHTDLIKRIHETVGVPLVLHGGSGGSIEDFLGAIDGGCAIVHISTELRVAYRGGLVKSIQENPDEIAGYKYLKGARQAMQKVAEDKLRLFNKI